MKKANQNGPLQFEGEINASNYRMEWVNKPQDAATRALLEEDSRDFMNQSLSTSCLTVVTRAEGP